MRTEAGDVRGEGHDEQNGHGSQDGPDCGNGPACQGHGRQAGRPRHRRLPGLLVLGASLILLLLGTAAPASAHAALRGTDPADGTVLKRAPRQVTLTFTESVGLLTDSFRVYDPRNHRVRTGTAGHAPGRSDTARVTLPAGLRTGTYTVAWRVVSADSHPVSGALTFSVGRRTAATTSVLPDRAENGTTTRLYDIARYLAYLSVALLLGTAAFVAYCRPPSRSPLRPLLLTGGAGLFASTTALFLLRGPYEEGTSPVRALALSSLARTATTRPGELLLARLALLLVAAACAVVLRRRRRRVPRRAVLAAAALLSLALSLTWAAAEHASAGLQVPLAVVAATLHLMAMAFWLGGLTALLTILRRTPPDPAALPARVLTRFSRLASTAVSVLVATGVYQSWRGLGSWQALTGTTYGRILLAKLAAVTVLLLAASWSRHWTARWANAPTASQPSDVPEPAGGTRPRSRVPEPAGGPSQPLPSSPLPSTTPVPPLALSPLPSTTPVPSPPSSPLPPTTPAPLPPGTSPYPRRLRRSVLAEVAAGVVVLVLSTLLTGTLPGRAAAEAADAARSAATTTGIPTASVTTIPFDVGTPGGRGKVQITLDPGRVGRNTVQAVVYGPDGGLSSVPELLVTLTLPDRRIGPLDTRVADRGGYWAADSFDLPMPGTWRMRVTVRVSEVDQVTVSRVVRVPR